MACRAACLCFMTNILILFSAILICIIGAVLAVVRLMFRMAENINIVLQYARFVSVNK